jgi:hypothetical protein
MKTYTLPQIKEALRKKQYKFFENGDYNLNIIGIRNVSDQIDNLFDDTLFLAYKVEDRFNIQQFPCTTQPGAYYMKNPMNKLGTAILVPGQYRGAYTIGLHQGKYEALRQCGLLKIYRDNDRDNTYDYQNITDSLNDGINIHKAGRASKKIDNWSAGCQVLAYSADFDILMALANRSAKLYGDKFTYTLLESTDF